MDLIIKDNMFVYLVAQDQDIGVIQDSLQGGHV